MKKIITSAILAMAFSPLVMADLGNYADLDAMKAAAIEKIEKMTLVFKENKTEAPIGELNESQKQFIGTMVDLDYRDPRSLHVDIIDNPRRLKKWVMMNYNSLGLNARKTEKKVEEKVEEEGE